MARDYAHLSSQFWTGETGRQLRRLGPEVQVVALYLISAPGSNMIGLYYLPLPTLCHETGLTAEGASKALRSLSEGGFAHYDAVAEVVWVPEMARYQVGESVQPRDHRHKAVVRELEKHRKCRYYQDFHRKYGRAFRLPEPSPFEGASKPLRSQDQEQDQEQEETLPIPPAGAGGSAGVPPARARTGGRAGRAAPDADPRFERFWAAYPRREKRADAARAFARLDPGPELLDRILAAVERQKRPGGCLEPRTADGRSVVPHPTTWLNGRRWEDEGPAPGPGAPAPAVDARERERLQYVKLVDNDMMDREQAERLFGGSLDG